MRPMLDLFDFLRDVNFSLHCVLVFCLMFVMDVAYAFYTIFASQRIASWASFWASMIVMTSA